MFQASLSDLTSPMFFFPISLQHRIPADPHLTVLKLLQRRIGSVGASVRFPPSNAFEVVESQTNLEYLHQTARVRDFCSLLASSNDDSQPQSTRCLRSPRRSLEVTVHLAEHMSALPHTMCPLGQLDKRTYGTALELFIISHGNRSHAHCISELDFPSIGLIVSNQ